MTDRTEEITATALDDAEFLSQTRDSLAALRRGERGVPLRVIQAEEQRRRDER